MDTIYEMLKDADADTLKSAIMSISESLEEMNPVELVKIKEHIRVIADM